MMKDTGAERRNFARERTHIQVDVSQDFTTTRGMMEYVSFGGAFISLPRTFRHDSIIQIKFDLPGEYLPFEGKARVVWSHKDKAIGIQFQDLADSERQKLERLLVG